MSFHNPNLGRLFPLPSAMCPQSHPPHRCLHHRQIEAVSCQAGGVLHGGHPGSCHSPRPQAACWYGAAGQPCPAPAAVQGPGSELHGAKPEELWGVGHTEKREAGVTQALGSVWIISMGCGFTFLWSHPSHWALSPYIFYQYSSSPLSEILFSAVLVTCDLKMLNWNKKFISFKFHTVLALVPHKGHQKQESVMKSHANYSFLWIISFPSIQAVYIICPLSTK